MSPRRSYLKYISHHSCLYEPQFPAAFRVGGLLGTHWSSLVPPGPLWYPVPTLVPTRWPFWWPFPGHPQVGGCPWRPVTPWCGEGCVTGHHSHRRLFSDAGPRECGGICSKAQFWGKSCARSTSFQMFVNCCEQRQLTFSNRRLIMSPTMTFDV